LDPHTGSSGLAYYVGYFELSSDGTMSFVREAANTVVTPPPAPQLTIGRSGQVSTISFVSSNSVTYKAYFTNTAGLTTPTTNWPALPNTLTGNGSTQSFQDTTSDPNRVYRVQAE
jgi:chitinase